MKNSFCFKLLIIFAWISFFTAATFSVCPLTNASDKEDAPNRPKIGLVLGGGGARGAAHVGVLKVLEETMYRLIMWSVPVWGPLWVAYMQRGCLLKKWKHFLIR